MEKHGLKRRNSSGQWKATDNGAMSVEAMGGRGRGRRRRRRRRRRRICVNIVLVIQRWPFLVAFSPLLSQYFDSARSRAILHHFPYHALVKKK